MYAEESWDGRQAGIVILSRKTNMTDKDITNEDYEDNYLIARVEGRSSMTRARVLFLA